MKHRGRILALFLVPLLALAGCGGGGGTSSTPTGDTSVPGGGTPTTPDTSFALTAATPGTLDRDRGGAVTLQGEGMRAPMIVRLFDEAGRPLGGSLPTTVSQDGTRATCEIPPLAARGAAVLCELRVENGGAGGSTETVALTLAREYRAIDGSGNHPSDLDRGRAGIALRRLVPSAYDDGVASLAGPDRPSARAVSNGVCVQETDEPSARDASGFLWQWGQFLDHDIVLTAEAEPEESAPIAVPIGDVAFDPFATGVVELPFHRSAYLEAVEPRQQVNEITSWIDASNVYGSDATRARALRTLDGTGRLRTSEGDLLPYNVDGLPNAGGTDASLFVAGDVRANEQVGLTAMHTLFVREHNRLADEIRAEDPALDGDEVYEEARRVVIAQMQVITYEEFLPLLLGPDAMEAYDGYDPEIDADLSNVFATAAYRFGHSLLPQTLLRLDAAGDESEAGHLSLRDAFFHPFLLVDEGGIEPVLRGLAAARSQALDTQVVEDVRSFLFGPPGAGGLDLAALNLQRGRDHGLASYVEVREALGMTRPSGFEDVTSTPEQRNRLEDTYGDVAFIDAWIGALAEDPIGDGLVGSLLRRIVADEFRRLRDGDRFFYERMFSGQELAAIRDTRLSDIIRRNTTIGGEIARDVFRVEGARPPAPQVQAQALTAEREDRLRTWRGQPPRPR